MVTEFIIDKSYEEKVKNLFYDDYYLRIADDTIKSRDFGAIEKSRSICQLCDGLKLTKVVDVGAGLCSVLSRLDKLKFASELYAIEVSPSAIRFIKERVNIPRLKAVYLLDTSKTSFENDFFDLGILSHVLEHVTSPIKLLAETLRICKYVVVEVPLDDCLFGNIHAGCMEKITGSRRCDDPIGHIHFFNRKKIQEIATKSGGKILKERIYRSWRIYHKKYKISIICQIFRSIIFYLLFKITKTKLVGTHYAMLIIKR